MNMVIGIDLGTITTLAAMLDSSGKPQAIQNDRGDDVTPTVLYLPASGPPLIGADAIEQGVIEPERLIRNFKLALGTAENLLPGVANITAVEALTTFLNVWKRQIEARVGFAIAEAVVTVPADFRDDQKQDVLDALKNVGIKVLRLVPEPSAAGMAYALEKSLKKARVGVYDLGGGTFDVSILQVDGAQLDVLATEGVRQLGGNDFSAALRELVLANVANRKQLDDPLTLYDIEQRIERAKISLGAQAEVPVVIDGAVIKVKQSDYHRAVDGLIAQTLECCDKALASAKLSYADLDVFIMAGGAARMPYVKERLAAHIGMQPRNDLDPEKAVVFGAAQAALAAMAQQGRTATVRGQLIPAPEMFLREITAHDVGCAVAESDGATDSLVNAVIIPRGTAIPCKKVDQFRLVHEQQTAVLVEILQGPANARNKDCLTIGELRLDKLPKEAVRSERIQVEYAINENGMVTATVSDRISGQVQTTSFEYRKGLQPGGKPAAA